ncbi:hypothetical protein IWW38_003912, partial [Coemansia aciculifera]
PTDADLFKKCFGQANRSSQEHFGYRPFASVKACQECRRWVSSSGHVFQYRDGNHNQ